MTGKPFFDKILMALNAGIVLLAVGLVFYSHNNIKRPPTDQVAEENQLAQTALAESLIEAHHMKTIVVNIYSEGTRLRYLDVEMGILPFKEEDKALIKEREYLFKNAMLDVAGKMTPEELSSITGKILLESRLKKATNEALGAPLVKKIFFPKFVVQ